jgi:hypothetical protein
MPEQAMRHIGYVLVGTLAVFAILLCVLALAICVVGALEHPESYWCGVAVASAVVGFWKLGEVAWSQLRALFG